jgi:uncharacterized protein YukE
MRVDPAALATAAAQVNRLAAVVADSCRGADGQVSALSGQVGGDLAPSVLGQWREARAGLGRLEDDFRQIGRALDELAAWFAELDRRAVAR